MNKREKNYSHNPEVGKSGLPTSHHRNNMNIHRITSQQDTQSNKAHFVIASIRSMNDNSDQQK